LVIALLTLLFGASITLACAWLWSGRALELDLCLLRLFFFTIHLGVDHTGLDEGPHSVSQHVEQQTNRPDKARDNQHAGHDPQHHLGHDSHLLLHHLRILTLRCWSITSSAASFLAIQGGTGVEGSQSRNDDNQRHDNHGNLNGGDSWQEPEGTTKAYRKL